MASTTDASQPTAFGELVQRYRERRGMSQERLAKEAQLSGGYISLIETGQRGKRPPRDTVLAIAQALGAPTEKLLEAAGRQQPGDEVDEPKRPTFEEFVRTDPLLRSDQKRILLDLYSSWVRRSG